MIKLFLYIFYAAMVYRILIQIKLFFLTASFLYAHVSVVGEQWEIGTWAPKDLDVNVSTAPSTSPSTTIPTSVVKEASLAYPTMEPSNGPSKNPSISPSASNAPSISFAPFSVTSIPSLTPSQFPSIMPSPQCHDHENYRSPLNALNCTQHLGTDCFLWKHLGLTDMQVEDLINSCPVSCGIPCDSLFVFGTNLTYRLLLVDNFLSPESTVLFEDASASYLENHILAKKQQSRFSLNRVELISQRVLEKVEPKRRLIRSLQASDSHLVDLEIIVAFRGFVLYVNMVEIETLIKEGIQTFGYMRALRFTNDPALQDVEVALDIGPNQDNPNPAATLNSSKTNNSSPWILTVAILAGTGIIVCVVVYFRLLHNKLSKKSDKDIDAPIISPAPSARSNIVPNFSYESIVRFAPINIGQRCDTPASMVDSTGDDSSLKTSPNASMISTTESGEEEHPLTGIVPSMIVYDCIEGSDELVQGQEPFLSTEKVKNVVPSRHMAATVSFRKALQQNSIEVLDKTMFTGIPGTFNHMAIYDVSNDKVNKNTSESIPLPQRTSESEALSTSDTTPVCTGAGERVSPDKPEWSHTKSKEMLLRQIVSDVVRVQPNAHTPSSSFRRNQLNHNQGRHIRIRAPRVGKLGLVLQSSESHGHVVIQVKEYSPIRGEIQVGDRIICIDGQDSTGMTLNKVTKLISGSNDKISGVIGNLEIIVWRRNSEMAKRNSIVVPAASIPKVSRHQRSVSGSSIRSATSAPTMGSYRSHNKYQNYSTTSHRSKRTKVIRDGRNQYHIASPRSERSASSTPNMYRNHARSARTAKITSSFSHQYAQSRTSDTDIDAQRRMIPPPLIPTFH